MNFTYEINFADSTGEWVDLAFITESNDNVAIEKATSMAQDKGCKVLDIRKVIYNPTSDTDVKSSTTIKKSIKASNSNDTVWDSTESIDYWQFEADDNEIKSTLKDMDYDLTQFNSVDEMREFLVDMDYQTDNEDLIYNVIPAIEKQCYGNKLWLIGNYQRWDGGRNALGYFDDVESGIKSICYPDYESHAQLLNVDGELMFTESTHDTPTGGTLMIFYSFKNQEAFDKADIDEDETLATGSNWWGNVDYSAEDPVIVKQWIENGWLTPIDANKLFSM